MFVLAQPSGGLGARAPCQASGCALARPGAREGRGGGRKAAAAPASVPVPQAHEPLAPLTGVSK